MVTKTPRSQNWFDLKGALGTCSGLLVCVFASHTLCAVTHDDGETMIPEFVVRFKARPSTTASLTIECSTYTIYEDTDNNGTLEWTPYIEKVTASTANATAWTVRSIIMRKGIPLDMNSSLKVSGVNVAEYQVMIKTPDVKYIPHVYGVPQKCIILQPPQPNGTTFDHEHKIMFLHRARTGGTAGKVEKASAGNDNLRISLGRGITGRPLGHLSVRKRYEPWIADISYETYLLKKDGNHHQIVCPQMVFDIVRNETSGAFTISSFDRETQPGVFVPVTGGTGYLDFTGLSPTATYSLAYTYNQAQRIEDYAFSRSEGALTLTSQAKRQIANTSASGYYIDRPCIEGWCSGNQYGTWCFPPICFPPIYIETSLGTIDVTDDIRDWKLQGSSQPDRLMRQFERMEFSAVAGTFERVTRNRSVKYDATGQAWVTEYEEKSTQDAVNMGRNAVFWPALDIKFDGATAAQFAGNVIYNYLSSYTPLAANSGSHLMLTTRVLPGGKWEKYTYHDTFESYGLVKTLTRPYKDSPANPTAPVTGALVTDYTYAKNWDGGHTLPASITTTLKGSSDQQVARTIYDYTESLDGSGNPIYVFMADYDKLVAYPTKVWVTRKTEFASATDPGQVSVVKRFRVDDWPWLRDLPYSEEFPDGRKEVYVYQAGSINPSTHQFTVDGFPDTIAKDNRLASRSIKIKGFTATVTGCDTAIEYAETANKRWQIDSVTACPGLSTADVTVTDPFGRLYSVETWALTGAGFVVTSKVVHKYDIAGNLIEKKRLVLNGSTEQFEPIYQAQYTTRNGDTLDYNTVSFDNSLTGGAQRTGRKQYERGEDGVIQKFYYDDYGRVGKTVYLAPPSFADLPNVPATQMLHEYDADNRVKASTVGPVQSGLVSDPNALRSEKQYNTLGMVTRVTDPGQRVTDYAYNNLDRTVTVTARGLGDAQYDRTTVKTSYLDGKLKSVSGNAVVPAFHDYVVVAGEFKETAYNGSSSGTTLAWTSTYKDWLGRTVRSEQSNPTAIGNLVQQNFYNVRGQLDRSTVSGLANELHRYDFTGQKVRTGLDLSQSAELEPGSTDRISEQLTCIVFQDSAFWEESISDAYPKNGLTAKLRVSTTLKRVSGFPIANVTISGTPVTMLLDSEVAATDASGVTTRQLSYVAPSRALNLKRTLSSLYTAPADQVFLNGKLVTTIDSSNVRQDFFYDAFGRLAVTSARKGPTTYEYRPGTAEKFRVKSSDRMWVEYEYDPAARVKWMKQYLTKGDTPSGAAKFARYAYNLRGQMEKTWGDSAVPVRNVYYEAADGLPELIGRLKDQISYNGGSGWTGDAWPSSTTGAENKTSYNYYRENGLISTETRHKTDVPTATQTTTYTYNIRGRLTRRTSPRGINTDYGYPTLSGELGTVTYSSGGSVAYTYDRLGGIATVVDAAGTRTFNYRDLDRQLDYEALPELYPTGARFTPLYDSSKRPSGQQLTIPGSSPFTDSYQFYAADGRLNHITTPLSASAFTYAYTPNSHLIASVTCAGLPSSGASGIFTVTSQYQTDTDRLQSVTTAAGRDVDRCEFQYDDQSRSWKSLRSGEVFKYFGTLTETSGYDDRDQLITAASAASSGSTTTPITGRNLAIDYDNGGNREYVDKGTERTTYVPTTLHQYSSRSGPAVIRMSGLAMPSATLTLRNLSFGSAVNATLIPLPVAATPALYYQGSVPFSGTPNWLPVQANTYQGSELFHTQERNVLAGSATEGFLYDNDGNLTDDSLWHYAYDGENRLVQIDTLPSLPSNVPRKRLIFTYDYLGRRVKKEVYDGNSTGTIWTLQSRRFFVYSGWNLIMELKEVGSARVPVTYYAWGLDASGSLQGAGGVGGLLGFVTGLDTGSPKRYCAVNDGSGNIAGLLDAQSGQLVAEYEYTPFGELLRANGAMAAENCVRFSSKYCDTETGLINFGFRYYSASLGRFINRDPRGDQGWANLVADLSAGGVASWSYVGQLLQSVHENRYGGEDASFAHSSEAGGGYKNSSQTAAPLLERKGYAASTAPLLGGGGSSSGGAPAWSHPYAYLNNDPLNDVEYLGLWSVSEWWRSNVSGYGGLLGFNGPADHVTRWMEGVGVAASHLPVFYEATQAYATMTGRDYITDAYVNRHVAFENLLKSGASTSLMFAGGAMGAWGRSVGAAGFLEKPSWAAAESRFASGSLNGRPILAPWLSGSSSSRTPLYWHGSAEAVTRRQASGIFADGPGNAGLFWATSRQRSQLGAFAWRVGGNQNFPLLPPRLVNKGGIESTYTLTSRESGMFSRAWGPQFSWNPVSWWKGGVGQYYHRPHAATWGLRARQLGEVGAIGGVSYGVHNFFED